MAYDLVDRAGKKFFLREKVIFNMEKYLTELPPKKRNLTRPH